MSKKNELTKDDYLWDGSGEPDAEIARLEKALGKFRRSRPAPEWPEISRGTAGKPRGLWSRYWFRFAGAAASVLILFSLWLAWRPKAPVAEPGAWGVTSLAGTPRVGKSSIAKEGQTGRLGIGQTLETDTQSRASISVPEIGRVE